MNNKNAGNSRRAFLLGLGGFTTASLLHQLSNSPVSALENDYLSNKGNKNKGGKSLRQMAAAKGIMYGGFHQRSPNDFEQDAKFQRTFLNDYGLIVGGFFGVTVGPFGKNNYDFNEIEPFFNFAQENNLSFRGHPMLWNLFNSDWLVQKFKSSSTTSAEINEIMINHVSTLGKKYAGKVSSWDVVNEVINVEDGRSDGLRDTTVSGVHGEKFPTWLNFLGTDYIKNAFDIAHQADPNAKLVLNETSLTYSDASNNSYWEQRRHALLNLLNKLKSEGAPVHAVGIQSHLLARFNNSFDGKKFRQFLKEVADMGLEIIISELDVSDVELPKNIQARDRLVAEAYYEYLSVVLDEPAVTTVINWGLSDRYSWLSDFAPRSDGAEVRPLLRDRQYNLKPAWKAVARAIKEAPKR